MTRSCGDHYMLILVNMLHAFVWGQHLKVGVHTYLHNATLRSHTGGCAYNYIYRTYCHGHLSRPMSCQSAESHSVQCHYNDVIMTTMASQITSLTVVYSTVYSDADQRKHQSSASVAFVWGIHRWIPRTKGQLREKVSIWWRQYAVPLWPMLA